MQSTASCALLLRTELGFLYLCCQCRANKSQHRSRLFSFKNHHLYFLLISNLTCTQNQDHHHQDPHRELGIGLISMSQGAITLSGERGLPPTHHTILFQCQLSVFVLRFCRTQADRFQYGIKQEIHECTWIYICQFSNCTSIERGQTFISYSTIRLNNVPWFRYNHS